jgi:hypothetical protein
MDFDEIRRIQNNLCFYLYPSEDEVILIDGIPRTSDIIKATLPKKQVADLMMQILERDVRDTIITTSGVRLSAKDLRVRLSKFDYDHQTMEYLVEGFDSLTLGSLDDILRVRRIGVKKFKSEADKAERKNVEKIEKLFRRLGIRFSKLEEDFERTAGVLYDALNKANADCIDDVKISPLGSIIKKFANGTDELSYYMGLVWACAESPDIAMNYALQYARKPDFLLSGERAKKELVEQTGIEAINDDRATVVILPYEGTNTGKLSLVLIGDILVQNKTLATAIAIGNEYKEELKSTGEELRRIEKDWEQERTDRDKKYNAKCREYETAKARIVELEANPAATPKELEELQGLRTERRELKEQVANLETELEEEREFGAVCSDEAATYEQKLILERRKVAELESRLPKDQTTVVQRPIYLVQDPEDPQLQAKIESRLGLNYYIVCTILGPGFNMFRNIRLSPPSLKKNTNGKLKEINAYLGNGNEIKLRDKEYKKHVDELIKGGAIVDHRGLTLMKPGDIKDPLLRKVVDLLYEAKKEAEN